MTHTQVLTDIYTKISSISGLPTVLYPNRKYTTTPNEFIRVSVMPLKSLNATIDGGILLGGLIQFDCVVLADGGEIKAAQIADRVIAAFGVGSKIGDTLKVIKPSYTSGGMSYNDSHYVIAVTAEYKALSK
jgi:hypothetical protein